MAASLQRLREVLKAEGISAYIIPTEDAHGSEYIANCDKRRAFISGFTGSAGTAVVTLDKAALWTDGRYFLQAEKQLYPTWQLMKSGMPGVPSMEQWIVDHIPKNGTVGIDSRLVSKSQADIYHATFTQHGYGFKAQKENFVDKVWTDRPALPAAPVFVHDIKYAGVSHLEKIENVQDKLDAQGCHGWLFTALDEIAWLLNLRGGDIPFNPVFMAYALVTLDDVTLFIEPGKVSEAVRKHLGVGVHVKPYDSVFEHLHKLEKPICIDPKNANLEVAQCLGKHAKLETSPITMWKAVKNEVEIEGMRQAHLRDAAALISFLAWLEVELNKTPAAAHNECSVSDKLEEFRAAQRDFVSLSFETIAGSGPNGAIIHYKPEPGTCAAVTKSALFLLDSGGQYRDGTTDVTRTVHFGEPSAEERRSFTRVLQGHIALDRAIFPRGTVGAKLDILARLPLFTDGLNYRHGTGHGVGAFLNVHEGPHGIGSRESAFHNPLEPGMTVTNEPGYYKDGHFGIRIENVLVVRKANTPNEFGGPYYCFEHITLAPIQTKLIDFTIATDEEIKWVNAYNAECLHKVGPLLSEAARQWLAKEATPIARPKV